MSSYMCVYKIWMLNKVKYSKISHRISVCQKLRTVEINASGPHALCAELWLTDYHLPDWWIGNNDKNYRSRQETERELIWYNAYYSFVHNTECFKKSFTTLKEYRILYRGHTQRF